jgi:two-component system sensor histidine kinase UhpB
VALRILEGETPARIKGQATAKGLPIYDWRELRRWNISETRLPARSRVDFRTPSAWAEYKRYIIGVVSLVAFQSAMIIALFVQRARQRRTERALRQSYEQNQDLAGRLINAQEEERARIARDLHDDLSQQLAVVGIMLSGLKRKIGHAGSPVGVNETVRALEERNSTLAGSVRSLSHELHPSVLQHAGLMATLQRHCADIEQHHQLKVSFAATDDLDALSPAVALCLFRVAQEALANAVRHARARTIAVHLAATNGDVHLSIEDDGVGFGGVERARSGLGLRSMEERVRLVQGSLKLESQPGQGTRLLVRVPYAKTPAAIVRH